MPAARTVGVMGRECSVPPYDLVRNGPRAVSEMPDGDGEGPW